jgi:bile acid-coenzyme A ligase
VTRATLDRTTNRLARAYAALGVEEGDFVTIGLPNSIEFYEACIATWKLGATPQPVSWRLPEREREEIIKLANPAIVVGLDAHRDRTTVPVGFTPTEQRHAPSPVAGSRWEIWAGWTPTASSTSLTGAPT